MCDLHIKRTWRYGVCDRRTGLGLTGLRTFEDFRGDTPISVAGRIASGLYKGYDGQTLVLVGDYNINLYRLKRGSLQAVEDLLAHDV